MTCHSKETLESMLEDVVNELDLSECAIEKHGPLGTPPSELVRLVLDAKDREIRALKIGRSVMKTKAMNEEVLGMDSAITKAKSLPYCSNMNISAVLVIDMGRRIAELEDLLLKERGE